MKITIFPIYDCCSYCLKKGIMRFSNESSPEEGFTLIEILVVILIIGILAAIAVPVFLNQRKTALDSSTISDVRSIAQVIETLAVSQPDSVFLGFSAGTGKPAQTTTVGLNHENMFVVSGVGSDYQYEAVKMSSGTEAALYPDAESGSYTIVGWNFQGKRYDGDKFYPSNKQDALARKSYLVYDSINGGQQR